MQLQRVVIGVDFSGRVVRLCPVDGAPLCARCACDSGTRARRSSRRCCHAVGSELRTHLISMAGLAARGGGVSGLEFQERETEITDGWIAELSSIGSFPETSPGKAERRHTVDEAVAAAERLHSDLIVLGSRRGVEGAPPSVSVACGIARRTACPVFVVKPEAG